MEPRQGHLARSWGNQKAAIHARIRIRKQHGVYQEGIAAGSRIPLFCVQSVRRRSRERRIVPPLGCIFGERRFF
jgi:hypothetical protein